MKLTQANKWNNTNHLRINNILIWKIQKTNVNCIAVLACVSISIHAKPFCVIEFLIKYRVDMLRHGSKLHIHHKFYQKWNRNTSGQKTKSVCWFQRLLSMFSPRFIMLFIIFYFYHIINFIICIWYNIYISYIYILYSISSDNSKSLIILYGNKMIHTFFICHDCFECLVITAGISTI